MITVDTIGRVRRAHFVNGKKIKTIARELRLARNTVRSIIRAERETERRYERREQPMPQLGAFVPALEMMLATNAKRPKRERLTYQGMFKSFGSRAWLALAVLQYSMRQPSREHPTRHPIVT